MTKSLDAKIAIVTGSDSGIGRATAVEFAKEGADVAVTWFQDGDGAEETRRQVEAQGRRAIGVWSTSATRSRSPGFSRRWRGASAHLLSLSTTRGRTQPASRWRTCRSPTGTT